MPETSESDRMAQKLIDALKDPVFREQLLDALAEEELDDARDAKIEAVLKSKGLESLSEDDILTALNPVNRTLKEREKKRETPPLFDLIWFEGKYIIASASHPQGVFEMWLAGSVITMGEPATDGKKDKAYPATPVLDNASNTWWVTWGDKAQDWFSAQFRISIPADSKDKTPLVTFKGTWHTKEDGQDVEKPFDGKLVRVSVKDTANDIAVNFEWCSIVLGGIVILAGLGLCYRNYRRRLMVEAAARGQAQAEVRAGAEYGRNALQERAVGGAIEVSQGKFREMCINHLAWNLYRDLPKEQFADFETRLTGRMKEVVDNYYDGPAQHRTAAEAQALRNLQKGQPPKEDIGGDIKTVISERVKALVKDNETLIKDMMKTFQRLEGLSSDQKDKLLDEVRERALERAMEKMGEQDAAGRYGGLAGIAFDQVTKFEHAVQVKFAADQVVINGANSFKSSGLAERDVFKNLITLAESLHEAQREHMAEHEIKQRRDQVLDEVQKLEKDLKTEGSKLELEVVQKHLVESGKAKEKAKEAKEAAEHLMDVEAKERKSLKLRELGWPKKVPV